MIILPVDQGFEHGPARSFAPNPAAYDPDYHYQLAIDAGLNAYAAPLGMLEAGADTFAGQIPTILKANSANSLIPATAGKDQAITASVDDALRLGCAAIGFTIYPGSACGLEMFEEISAIREEAARKGVATVIWSYPRGEALSKDGETAIDIAAYAAQIAALLGAHVIKIKLSTDHLELGEAKKVYEKQGIDIATQAARVRHCVQSAFNGRRIMVFSGGAAKSADDVYDDARAIRDGGGNGSIIGRNSFQRSREDAVAMLDRLVAIYKGRVWGADSRIVRESLQNRGIPVSPKIRHTARDGNRRAQVSEMYPESETGRSSFSSAVFAAMLIMMMGYLTFAALEGEHGLFRLFQIQAQEARLKAELASLKAERALAANKTHGLSEESLDLDLLDEQARKVLGLARADEILIR
jgi:class I fructose-bisphosphate aldolase